MAIILDGTNGAFLPTWTTATRPASPANGEIGYNSTTAQLDQYVGSAWSSVPTGSAAAATPTALGTVYGNTTPGSGTENCALGYQALNVATGSKNCALGTYSGFQITSGIQNTLVGSNSGAGMTTGSYNSVVGYIALSATTTGNENSALGYGAGATNTTGAENVAIGSSALFSNTTANAHVAVGRRALYANTTGDSNTAVGHSAGKAVTTGSYNAIFGAYAGQSVTTGGRNCLIGEGAGSSVTTGNYITLVGDNAGNAITTGSGVTCVGREAGANLVDGSYGTYIGYGSTASSSSVGYEMVICTTAGTVSGKGSSTGFISVGGGSIYQGNNSSSWATTSDRRLKKNIVNNTEGLDKITQIQVRNFEYRLPKEVTELDSSTAVDISGVQLGVIAQELQQVCPDCVKEESTGVLRVDSDNVFWHMVNAIKELKLELDELKAKVA